MIWWYRARMGSGVLLALTAVMTLGAAAPAATVPVPLVVAGVSVPLPLPLVLPVAPVVVLLLGQARAASAAEGTAVRSVVGWDVGAASSLAFASVGTGAMQWWLLDWPMGVAMARDLVGYLGLALLVRWVAGFEVAAVIAAVFPFFCASFGMTPGLGPRPWAWPFHEPTSVAAAGCAVLLLAAGIAAAGAGPAVLRRRLRT
jgi:hypothetical protein